MTYYYISMDGNYVMTNRRIFRNDYTPITKEEYDAALKEKEEEANK